MILEVPHGLHGTTSSVDNVPVASQRFGHPAPLQIAELEHTLSTWSTRDIPTAAERAKKKAREPCTHYILYIFTLDKRRSECDACSSKFMG